jgi:acetolactate synthase-1/2/3 large subunit
LTGGEAVVRSLEAHGVRHVFGIPGDHTIPIYAALGQSHISHCAVRHEQGAGFMADGYARASGEPGVAIVIGGPGLTNIATALAEANADGASVLAISADTPTTDRGAGRDHNHELPNQHVAAGVLCQRSERIDAIPEIATAIAEAFHRLRTGRRGSIHVGVPIDLLTASALVDVNPGPSAEPPSPAVDQIEGALCLLRGAQRPLVLMGGGARFATASAAALAEAIPAPVMTTWSGADAFSSQHPLWVGGGFHLKAARQALLDADVVLAVGTRFGRSDFWVAPPQVAGDVIRVDIEPDHLEANIPATVGIIGDARRTMDALSAALCRRDQTQATTRAARLRAAIDTEANQTGAAYRPWLSAMREALPHDGVIAADSTLATYLGFRSLHIPEGGAFLYPNAYGTLGYALPAAIGARIALGSRRWASISQSRTSLRWRVASAAHTSMPIDRSAFGTPSRRCLSATRRRSSKSRPGALHVECPPPGVA